MNGLLFTYAEDYCVYLVVRSVHMIICCSWWYFVSVALQCEITFSSYVFLHYYDISFVSHISVDLSLWCQSIKCLYYYNSHLYMYVCYMYLMKINQSINQLYVYEYDISFESHLTAIFMDNSGKYAVIQVRWRRWRQLKL